MTSSLTRTLGSALAVCLAAALVTAPAASGDGDPASDILLVQSVFFPYRPATSPRLERELDGATAAAARAGLPIKVALIASPVDLGVITSLWPEPRRYADYLDDEISFGSRPQPLLVVMADGYGARGLTPAETAAVASLPTPAGRTSDDLASAALSAVRLIARAAGHPISATAVASPSGSGSASVLIAAALGLAALGIAGAIAVVTLRRHPSPRSRRLPR